MKLTRTLLLKAFLFLCLFAPDVLRAEEPILRSGQTFVLRLSGVPAEEISLVSQPFAISDAGTVHLPYLKVALKVSGMKPSALARKIEGAYRAAEIYTQPSIQISVNTGPNLERFISVIGEVRTGRTVGYSPGITLLDAIAQCGGYSDFAGKQGVKLSRGKKVTYHDLRAGDPKQNVELQPGDIVTVKPRGRGNR